MIELLCTDYNKKATSIHYYFGNAVLVRFLQDEVIVFDDLDEFSEELRENVKLLMERFG